MREKVYTIINKIDFSLPFTSAREGWFDIKVFTIDVNLAYEVVSSPSLVVVLPVPRLDNVVG